MAGKELKQIPSQVLLVAITILLGTAQWYWAAMQGEAWYSSVGIEPQMYWEM